MLTTYGSIRIRISIAYDLYGLSPSTIGIISYYEFSILASRAYRLLIACDSYKISISIASRSFTIFFFTSYVSLSLFRY